MPIFMRLAIGLINILCLSTGAIMSGLAFSGLPPYNYSAFSILMWPTFIAVTSTMNIDLLRELMFGFDAVLLGAYGTFGCLSLGLSTPDMRCFTYFSGWYVMVMTIYADACPEKLRVTVGKIGSSVLGVWLVLCCSVIYWDAVPNSQLMHFTMGKTVYSTLDIAFIYITNYIIFLPNHIYSVVSAPGNYIILRSRMKSVNVKENEASILTSVQKSLNVSGSGERRSRRKSRLGSGSPFNRGRNKTRKSKVSVCVGGRGNRGSCVC
ncbi:hypothetical protein TrLO_g7046 [Triparma laevis f. longispina]|uniref:Uncharacterized protein n=1 Tax=Triparma laevis f. longispina TaxID=1714387 RepID=A0A9W7FU03_9STRA|nr:hypothetical protein TrLO_g7046 [Triparma laevis f. longispina]